MTHDSLPKSAFSHLPQDFFAKKNLFLFTLLFFLNLLFTLRNKEKKAKIYEKSMIIDSSVKSDFIKVFINLFDKKD